MVIQRLLEYEESSSPSAAVEAPSSPNSAVSDDFPAPDVIARVDSYYEETAKQSPKSVFFRGDSANPQVSEPSSSDDDDDVYDYNYYFEDDDDEDEEKDNKTSFLAPQSWPSHQSTSPVIHNHEGVSLHTTTYNNFCPEPKFPAESLSTNAPIPVPRGRPPVVMRGGFLVPRHHSNSHEGYPTTHQHSDITPFRNPTKRNWVGLATRHRSLESVSPSSTTEGAKTPSSGRNEGKRSSSLPGRSTSPGPSQATTPANHSSGKHGLLKPGAVSCAPASPMPNPPPRESFCSTACGGTVP